MYEIIASTPYVVHYTSSREPFGTLLLTLYITVLQRYGEKCAKNDFLDLFIYEFLGFLCFRPQQNIKIVPRHELCISGGWDEAPGGTRGCPSVCLLKKKTLLWQTCPPPTGSTSLYFLCPRGRDGISHIHSARLSVKNAHTFSETQKASAHTHTHSTSGYSTLRLRKSCNKEVKADAKCLLLLLLITFIFVMLKHPWDSVRVVMWFYMLKMISYFIVVFKILHKSK